MSKERRRTHPIIGKIAGSVVAALIAVAGFGIASNIADNQEPDGLSVSTMDTEHGIVETVTLDSALAGGGGSDGVESGHPIGHLNCTRLYWDDFDSNGNPKQGWNETSKDEYWDWIEDVCGTWTSDSKNGKSVYSSAADKALANARARGNTDKARIVAVAFVWKIGYDNKPGFGYNYWPDSYKASKYWMMPGPDESGGFKPYRDSTKELWLSPHADSPTERWIDYIYRIGMNDVEGGYDGTDPNLSVIVIAVNDQEPPHDGYIQIQKSTTANTSSGSYSVKGAEYTVYSDSACTKSVAVLTTKDNGSSDVTKVPAGTYYIKETKASKGHKLDPTKYGPYDVTKTTSTSPQIVKSNEPPKTGIIKLEKYSAKSDWTWDTEFYSLAQAEYQVRNASGTLVATMVTDDAGKAQTGSLPLGTYTVKESKPSKGFRLDPTTYTVTLTETSNENDTISTLVRSPEEPERGNIQVQKKTGSTVSLDYDTYSLAGAQYQIIDKKGKVWETITTDIYGSATSMDIPLGHYTVKEIVPPQGYDVNITPTAVTITEDRSKNAAPHLDYETPHPDPNLAKKQDTNVDEIGTLTGAQGAATLLDATYKLTYYDGYYTTFDQINKLTPKKTSTMKTQMGTGIYGGEAILTLGPENMVYNGKEWYLPLGTYKLEEIEAPEGYNLDVNSYIFQCRYDEKRVPRIYLQSTPGAEASVSINQAIEAGNLIISHETVKRGDLSIMKYIEDTTDPDKYPDKKRPCEGVKFRIINNNDYPVLNVVTGKPVYKGEVVYELTTNAEGYASTRLEMTETGQTGLLNNYDPTGQAPNALAYGNYLIEEDPTTTPEGYIPIQQYQGVSINSNFRYQHVVFENKTGTVVRVNKIDNGTKLNVRGTTKFEILDSDMNVMKFKEPYPSNAIISMFETGIDGTAIIPEKFLMGTYYIREVEAPDGYLHTPELVEFKIDSSTVNDYDHPYDVYLGDDPAKGKVIITKKDADTGGTITAAPAVFDIYADADIVTQDGTVRHKKDDLVETITTVNGVATSGELFIGHYRAVEVTAPTGYLLNTEPVKFDIVYEGDKNGVADKLSYTRCDMSDVAVLGGIVIRKTDVDSNGLISRVPSTFEVRAAENITGGDGYVWVPKGQVVATVTTVNGIARTEMNLHLGKYEIVEVEAPYGYVLDSTPVPVDVVYADQYTPVVTAEGVKADRLSTIDYRLTKLDRETGKSVWEPNCEIGIYAAENIVLGDERLWAVADQLIGSATTDESGYVTSTLNLPVGKYYLKEIKAPYGYVLDTDKTYAVEATWDNGETEHRVMAASISDVPAKGTITFTKADAETGKTIPVAGIKAQVIANEDIATGDGTIRAHKDEVVTELETDASGIAQSSELYLGSYRVVETLAPEGYLINEVPVNVELVYENQNIPVITRPSQIFDENAKGIIEVTKIDRETSNVIPIAGTTFEVRAKSDIVTPDGTVRVPAGELACEPIVTDDTGKAVTPSLYIGTYTIIETQAPHGYVLDETPHDVVIAYKDQHTALTLASSSVDNVAQKGVVQVTKLDAESGLAVLAAGAKFEIKAVEDIYTGDGTKRISAGDVADVIETDERGLAVSKALYLGKYEIREIEAPTGYTISDEVVSAELVYGDQIQSVVFDIESIANQPVKGIISIHKIDAEDGSNLGGVKYEVRAAKDIVSGDGVTRHEAGAVVAELVTDENGNASTGELYLGEYVLIETSQLDGYKLDTAEHAVTLTYADQVTPIVYASEELVNVPTSIPVNKVSTSDPNMTVEGTTFAGWLASDESEHKAPFAVFASDDVSISSVSVTYEGQFDTVGSDTVEPRTFELVRYGNEEGYALYTSDEPIEQGNYVLHVTYRTAAGEKSIDIPFAVNEYDTSAIFAIGEGLVATGEGANRFAHETSVLPTVPETDVPGDMTEVPALDAGDGSQVDEVVEGDENADIVFPTEGDENEGFDIPSNGENASGTVSDGEQNTSDDAVQDNTSGNIVITRVPVILAKGSFATAVTDENGRAEFKYVKQGRAGFAELVPAAGFVSDRTPGYVDISAEGTAASTEVTGNVVASRSGELQFTFADDQTRLHISKRDITTNEELPGNVLSVFKYVETENGGDEITQENYGELLDSWVSQDEPHLMELLPHGTYILKEEKPVEGYTTADSIKFKLNDTGVEQQVVMNNERESGVADELITENPLPLGQLLLTGDMPFKLMLLASVMAVSIAGVIFIRWSQRQ